MRHAGGEVARWLLPALSLHVAVAFGAAAWSRNAASGRPAARVSAPATNSELTLLEEEGAEAPQARDDAPGAASGVRHAPREGAPPAGALVARSGPALRDAEPALLPSSDTASVELLGQEEADSAPVAGSAPAARADVPALSLAQLGIGENPFLAAAPELRSEAERVQQRLQTSLRQGSLERERAQLGPAGEVVASARQLVLGNELLSETRAVMKIRVNPAGVASVDVLEVSSQAQVWQKVAADLLRNVGALGPRLAGSSEGFTLKLSLGSGLKLPSGADPGLRLGVLGKTLKPGAGSNSASLSLSPTAPLHREQIFDSAGRQLDRPIQLEAGLLKLKWDVGDLGAAAQRVVEVAVLSLETGVAQ